MLMSPMRDGRDGTSEDSATQLLICEPLSFATSSYLTLINQLPTSGTSRAHTLHSAALLVAIVIVYLV